MVAATSNRLFSLSDKERREKLDLRDVVFDGKNIWAATKEGEVLHLTPALEPVGKMKFPFAHFLGMIVGVITSYSIHYTKLYEIWRIPLSSMPLQPLP